LKEIFEIADSVTVLKDGKLVDTKPIQEIDQDDVVRMMIGRQLTDYFPPKDTLQEDIVFQVRNLSVKINYR
jgi:ABC-type sugar transport system ATPase subunit